MAVKVQRPDLLEAVSLDFHLARGIAAAITRLSQGKGFFGGRLAVRSDLVAAVDEYGSRLFEELDYRIEVRGKSRRLSSQAKEGLSRPSFEAFMYVPAYAPALVTHDVYQASTC